MKAAVVYFSLEGNTKYIAEFIGRVIGGAEIGRASCRERV